MTHAVLIDDNEMGLKVLANLLDIAGVSYTQIQRPTEAKAVLKSLPEIDVIFLDLEMPVINGYEMLQLIKGELGIQAPVIACTVHTSEIQEARELGFDGFLGKPLRMQQFPQQLANILNGVPVWVAE